MGRYSDQCVKKTLDAYRGGLTAAQIANGMNAACENANRLADDAHILLDAARIPSALAVAILAIEETGKISILRRLAIATNDREISDAWKEYRSHTSKNVMWMFPALIAGGARKLEDFRPLFSGSSDHPFVLDQLKQISFYTDCLGKAHWSVPCEVIDESLARSIVMTAKLLAGKPTHTEKEVALWSEHMRPAYASRDLDLMKHALTKWHAAMHANGLTTGDADGMDRFIFEGIRP